MWLAVGCVAAVCLGAIAIHRGEHISSLWLVLAAACSYSIAYRFYAKFIAATVMLLTWRCDQRSCRNCSITRRAMS